MGRQIVPHMNESIINKDLFIHGAFFWGGGDGWVYPSELIEVMKFVKKLAKLTVSDTSVWDEVMNAKGTLQYVYTEFFFSSLSACINNYCSRFYYNA